MRVYLPSTLALLAGVQESREIGPAPLAAHAVTPALREWYAGGGDDELEYAALTAAARASLRLLAADPSAPRRRVVLAAEMPDRVVEWAPGGAGLDDDEPSRVRLTSPVPWKKIASGHVDDAEAEADVAAAVAALPAADAGDDDAGFTVDGAEGHELLWYATQEFRDLL
ncbi:hypothetical protein BJF79_17125 [Actinomadura sp. CNU-125]|uniref:DUF6912 family protein n=1 Tax=Actinomadura sp. CNU-125 TaxID=1904961 RepID=UPI000968F9B2|nr:hypothetical protein [Actinomadura sp. CNU-125]OLT18507.1 hypothetical protein BJF79_17125 [Actinomadura sp. CNU-125]